MNLDILNPQEFTQEKQMEILTKYYQERFLSTAVNEDDRVLRKLLLSLVKEFINTKNKVNELANEYDPSQTTKLIEEWEEMVGIPDDCFQIANTIEERRNNVLLKLAGVGVETAKQFENLASIIGVNIKVSSYVDAASFPLKFPILFTTANTAPYIIYVQDLDKETTQGFPLQFPAIFSNSPNALFLKCLFDRLKPANTIVIFN